MVQYPGVSPAWYNSLGEGISSAGTIAVTVIVIVILLCSLSHSIINMIVVLILLVLILNSYLTHTTIAPQI